MFTKKILEWANMDPMKWFLMSDDVTKALLQMTILVCQLEDPKHITRAFYEVMTPVKDDLPKPFSLLFRSGDISPRLLAKELKTGMRFFADRFIAGDTLSRIAHTIRSYEKKDFSWTVDVLCDKCVSEKEAYDYIESYQELIRALPAEVNADDLSASIKIYAGYSQMDSFSPEYTADMICERFDEVFCDAASYGWHIYLDALEYDYREIQLRVFEKLFSKYGDICRFVLQSYLQDTDDVLSRLVRLKAHTGDDVWVRLVLGAYHSFEQNLCQTREWNDVVYTDKNDTLDSFLRIFQNGLGQGLTMIGGTHNADLIAHCVRMWCETCGILPPEQQLIYGMGEPFGAVLKQYGIQPRFYMPVVYGGKSFTEALGYLIRRIDDNTGPHSFIRRHNNRANDIVLRLNTALSDVVSENREVIA